VKNDTYRQGLVVDDILERQLWWDIVAIALGALDILLAILPIERSLVGPLDVVRATVEKH
jgi:hypothetical protein